jgi:hypothetical protein
VRGMGCTSSFGLGDWEIGRGVGIDWNTNCYRMLLRTAAVYSFEYYRPYFDRHFEILIIPHNGKISKNQQKSAKQQSLATIFNLRLS